MDQIEKNRSAKLIKNARRECITIKPASPASPQASASI